MIIYLIGAFSADKNHIHHKLMHMGMTQHQALCTILLLAVSYIAMNGLLFWWGLPLTHTLQRIYRHDGEDAATLGADYLEHRSWWLDLKILVKTFMNIVFGKKF